MIHEDRIRTRLQRAIGYEPPSPGFGSQPLSKVAVGRLERRIAEESRNTGLLTLVAAVLALAVVVTLVLGARALHLAQLIPAHPGPHARLVIKTNGPPCGGSGSAGPIEMFSSGAGWASGPGYLADVAGQTLAKGPYRTTDGGVHWIKVAPPTIANLSPDGETEFFLDSNHAWVAEAAGSGNAVADHVVVFTTADAGRTWLQSAALRITPADRSDVIWEGSGYSHWMCFIDSQHGWLLVESGPASPMGPTWRTGALYRTVDGGLSWKLIANNPGSTVVRTLGGNCGGYGIGDGVVFSSSVTGWLPLDGCASSDVLLVTHDGGVTWSARHVPVSYPTVPYFTDSEHAILLGQGAVMATTSDGGLTWVTQPALPDQCSLLTFIDPTNGWCIGHGDSTPGAGWFVFRTRDGGHTWVTESGATTTGWGLTFIDTETGYQAVGESPNAGDWALFRTVDGGLTWTRIS